MRSLSPRVEKFELITNQYVLKQNRGRNIHGDIITVPIQRMTGIKEGLNEISLSSVIVLLYIGYIGGYMCVLVSDWTAGLHTTHAIIIIIM